MVRPDATSSSLGMGSMFDDIQNFFSEFGGGNQNDATEDGETTENRIVTIPGKFSKLSIVQSW